MQVVSSGYAVRPPMTPERQFAGIAATLARSTRLTFEEKQHFMQMLKDAATRPDLLKKIMLLIAETEASRPQNRYAAHSAADLLAQT